MTGHGHRIFNQFSWIYFVCFFCFFPVSWNNGEEGGEREREKKRLVCDFVFSLNRYDERDCVFFVFVFGLQTHSGSISKNRFFALFHHRPCRGCWLSHFPFIAAYCIVRRRKAMTSSSSSSSSYPHKYFKKQQPKTKNNILHIKISLA